MRQGTTGAIFLILALLTAGLARAQEEPEATPAVDVGEFFGAGGPWIGGVALELGSLNARLTAAGFPALSERLIAFGGSGQGGARNGLRWGGSGGGGELRARAQQRSVRLRLNWGGLWLSYGLLSRPRFELAVGALVSGGSAQLELSYRRPADFQDAIAAPLATHLVRTLFVLEPRLELRFLLTSWLALRLTGGFFYAFGGDWQAAGLDLPGPPANFSGWSASLGVEFGSWEQEGA